MSPMGCAQSVAQRTERQIASISTQSPRSAKIEPRKIWKIEDFDSKKVKLRMKFLLSYSLIFFSAKRDAKLREKVGDTGDVSKEDHIAAWLSTASADRRGSSSSSVDTGISDTRRLSMVSALSAGGSIGEAEDKQARKRRLEGEIEAYSLLSILFSSLGQRRTPQKPWRRRKSQENPPD